MDAKAPDFIAFLTAEIGGTAPWAGFNVMLAANMLREAAAMTTQIHGEIIPSDKPGSLSMGVRQAAGVCVGIALGTRQVILGTRAIAMALACGNTVILKASEQCPGLHVMIGQVMVEAGLPDGRRQRHHQCAGGRGPGGRGAYRRPRSQARQLHRLHPRRPDHRRTVRPHPGRRCSNSAARLR